MPDGSVAWLELADVAEGRRRRRDVAELEVHIERLPVEGPTGKVGAMEGFQLRRERDAPRRDRDVQRLDPETVAGEEQRLRRGVPDGEREHTAQLLHAIGALVLVEMENGLGVALGRERVSAGQELGAELAIVVDLAVEDDDLRAILV